MNGLNGFVEAIGAVYPHSQVQWCIVPQIRFSTRCVSYKDIKPLMADLKKVYTAATEDEAPESLMMFKEKWGEAVPLLCQKLGRETAFTLCAHTVSHPETQVGELS